MKLKVISILPNAIKLQTLRHQQMTSLHYSSPATAPQHGAPLAHYFDVDIPGFQASAGQEGKLEKVGLGHLNGLEKAWGQGSVFPVLHVS